jgi:hypothetical protein
MTVEVPDACTLPTAEQPLRLAEFGALFATAVRDVETITETHTRLRLSGPPGLAASVRDLTARETECCSFFRFTVTEEGERTTEGEPTEEGERTEGDAVVLDVEVPEAYAVVLRGLTGLARGGGPPVDRDGGHAGAADES